jgi:NNP family nitrate/nitrite transporter-like MFS transporter
VAAGLYFPSGITIITELASPKDFGKAIAIHELAPSLGFLSAPLIVEILLNYYSWNGVLILFGIASILSGILFVFFGKGGTSRGEALNAATFRIILKEPSYWIILIYFSLGVGNNVGLYTMLPLYLVSERGMVRSLANTLLGLSRISTLITTFLAGWMTDRVGPKQALRVIFLATGTVIVLLGVVSGSWMIPFIFLQSMLASSFVPPVFAAIYRIGARRFSSNVAISLTMPFSSVLGSGAIPAGIGFVGKMESLSFGIAMLGGVLIVSSLLVRYLQFADH